MADQIAALSSLIDEVKRVQEARTAAPVAPTAESQSPSFAQVLAQVSLDTVGALRTAEVSAIEGLHGRASTLQVVEAINQAEQALSTAVAVRDKAVQAYQEISRMAI